MFVGHSGVVDADLQLFRGTGREEIGPHYVNFMLIAVCMLSGFLLRRYGNLPENAHIALNTWLVYVGIPATALLYVPTIEWSAQMVWPVLTPWLTWLGAWIIWGRWKQESPDERRTRGALLLSAGLCNTSFVGFPLTSAYYGEEGLRVAVVCDQMSFLLLSTVGVLTSLRYSGTEQDKSLILKKLVTFPPFLGFMVGLLLPQVATFGSLPVLWQKLSATLIPIALFSIGLQLDTFDGASDSRLHKGLLYKLFLAPAVMAVLIRLTGGAGLIAKVAVFEVGMATMATTSVLAVAYGLNARICNLMIGVGIPLSLLTSFLWYHALEWVF